MFVSWTSCVQAARRSFQKMDAAFFRRASVASNPLAPLEPFDPSRLSEFRRALGVADHEILLGRLSRPEPNKWTPLVVDAFRRALRRAPQIKLLLREPPPEVAAQLRQAPDASRFIILPATADPEELRLTISALDVVLHTSLIGESFGYGIAEPMNLGKPVITHSVPWGDQGQIELARHGECGFICSTPGAMADAIVGLALDSALRRQLGTEARRHIRLLADPQTSTLRVESFLHAAFNQADNPFVAQDVAQAAKTAVYLDQHQFGHSFLEQITLRPFHYRVRAHQWRKNFLAAV